MRFLGTIFLLSFVCSASICAAADDDDGPPKTKDGKIVNDYDALAKMKGDASKGEAVFRNEKGANCVNCHQINGKGKNVGPPLDAIGEKPKEVIFESIIKPSAAIQHGFEMCTVKLKQGAVIVGLLLQDGEDEVIIRTQDGEDHTIKGDEIAKKTISDKSMMPEGLPGLMTLQELLDLVEWLSTQTASGQK